MYLEFSFDASLACLYIETKLVVGLLVCVKLSVLCSEVMLNSIPQ
jgi:hypothetical protein